MKYLGAKSCIELGLYVKQLEYKSVDPAELAKQNAYSKKDL